MLQVIAQQFSAGGSFMWVILGVLAFAVAVMIERAIYFFFYCDSGTSKVVGNVLDAINKENVELARIIVNRKRTPFNVLMKTAIERYAGGATIERIMEGVERVSIRELPRISRREITCHCLPISQPYLGCLVQSLVYRHHLVRSFQWMPHRKHHFWLMVLQKR